MRFSGIIIVAANMMDFGFKKGGMTFAPHRRLSGTFG